MNYKTHNLLKNNGSILLIGKKQTGKSALMQHILSKYKELYPITIIPTTIIPTEKTIFDDNDLNEKIDSFINTTDKKINNYDYVSKGKNLCDVIEKFKVLSLNANANVNANASTQTIII